MKSFVLIHLKQNCNCEIVASATYSLESFYSKLSKPHVKLHLLRACAWWTRVRYGACVDLSEETPRGRKEET